MVKTIGTSSKNKDALAKFNLGEPVRHKNGWLYWIINDAQYTLLLLSFEFNAREFQATITKNALWLGDDNRLRYDTLADHEEAKDLLCYTPS